MPMSEDRRGVEQQRARVRGAVVTFRERLVELPVEQWLVRLHGLDRVHSGWSQRGQQRPVGHLARTGSRHRVRGQRGRRVGRDAVEHVDVDGGVGIGIDRRQVRFREDRPHALPVAGDRHLFRLFAVLAEQRGEYGGTGTCLHDTFCRLCLRVQQQRFRLTAGVGEELLPPPVGVAHRLHALGDGVVDVPERGQGFGDRAHVDDAERDDLQTDAVLCELFDGVFGQMALDVVAVLGEYQVDEVPADDVDQLLARYQGEHAVRIRRRVQVVPQAVDAVLHDQVDLQQVGVAGQDGERRGTGIASLAGDALAFDAHHLADVCAFDEGNPIVQTGLDHRGDHLPEAHPNAAFFLLDDVNAAGQQCRDRHRDGRRQDPGLVLPGVIEHGVDDARARR